MPRTPQAASASRGTYAIETITYYHGTANVYHPVPERPWSSYVEPVTCTHRHTRIQDAEKCGDRLGKREAARLSAQAAKANAEVACDRQVGYDDLGGEPRYIAYCASHHTAASMLHTAAGAAAGDAWVCPWAQFVKAGAR